MPNYYSAPELIHRDTARWQPYAAILNPTITSDSPTFITTDDPLELIPSGFPYPSGGTNLGIINGKVSIRKGATLEDEPPLDLNTTSSGRFYSNYKASVEFELLSSGRKAVSEIFDAPGYSSDMDFAFGGLSDAPGHVLALMFRDLHHEDVYLCYLFWSVTPLPADEEFGALEPSVIKANFKCYAGFDPDDPTCLRTPGTQLGRKIYINASGAMVDPDNPSATPDPNANNDAYPALTMSNML